MGETRHVVLVTYGEPPTAAFAAQLVYSWRILWGLTRTVAPIPQPLVPLIALARAWMRRRSWRARGYTSPLEPITASQAQRLRAVLAAADQDRVWRVHVAYEFRRPCLGEVLTAIPQDERVCVIPMYATDSAFTHAMSRDAAATHHLTAARPRGARVLDALDSERLGELAAAHVMACIGDQDVWRGEQVALLLAAHGTLIEPARLIDTGFDAAETLCGAIARPLSGHFGVVANGWLNHTRGGRWTQPSIEHALDRLAAAGYTRVVYFPYGFLADNAESQLEGRVALAKHPSMKALHLPCLNDSAPFVDLLARQVLEAGGIRAPLDGAASAFEGALTTRQDFDVPGCHGSPAARLVRARHGTA